MLHELKSRTLADDVAHNLLGYIRRKNLVPGDSLPKEEELASQLNVSRHIVREGVSQLKAYGLVESRKRRGIVVTQPNIFAGMHRVAEAEVFSKREWFEFISIRIIMEIGMTDLIYSRATAEDIAQLRELAGEPIFIHSVKDEIAFHSKLFAIGGNFMANQFMEALVASFKYQLADFDIESQEEKETHADICNALEFGTKEEFCKTVKTHFKQYLDLMETWRKGGDVSAVLLKQKFDPC